MPLDPQVDALLQQMAALGLPALWSLEAAEARAQAKARNAAVPPGPDVATVEDRMIPGPAGEIPVRIYTPRGQGPFPVLVYFHGGGWVIGDIDSHDGTTRRLTDQAGCVTVSVDYRLAPEHKFPAAADDSYAATAWVAEHASELNVDPTRLAVGGDSAGGNLAAVVSLMARDRGGPKIAFQLLVYPVTDYDFDRVSYRENAEGYLLTTEAMRWFWAHYLEEESQGRHPHASPLQAEDLSGLPPALVITAEYDPLHDEGEEYAERLKAAGVPVTATRYDGQIHGFFGMPHVLDGAKIAVSEAARALREVFSAQPV